MIYPPRMTVIVQALLALLALLASPAIARAEIKADDCTVAKQCPTDGTSCSHFNSDKTPLCPRNLEKTGYEIRCSAPGTTTTTVVGCKPGAPPAKTGMCQRSSIATESPSSFGFAFALVALAARARRRRVFRRAPPC
jgi:MYXO-CTERM domain-containing protein